MGREAQPPHSRLTPRLEAGENHLTLQPLKDD